MVYAAITAVSLVSGNETGKHRGSGQATIVKRDRQVSGNEADLSRQVGETKGCSHNQLFAINQVTTRLT